MPWAAIMAIATAVSAVGGLIKEPRPEEPDVDMRGFTGGEYQQHRRKPAQRFGGAVGSNRRGEGLMDAVTRSRRRY